MIFEGISHLSGTDPEIYGRKITPNNAFQVLALPYLLCLHHPHLKMPSGKGKIFDNQERENMSRQYQLIRRSEKEILKKKQQKKLEKLREEISKKFNNRLLEEKIGPKKAQIVPTESHAMIENKSEQINAEFVAQQENLPFDLSKSRYRSRSEFYGRYSTVQYYLIALPILSPNLQILQTSADEVQINNHSQKRSRQYYKRFGKDLRRSIVDAFWIVNGKEDDSDTIEQLRTMVLVELRRMQLVSESTLKRLSMRFKKAKNF